MSLGVLRPRDEEWREEEEEEEEGIASDGTMSLIKSLLIGRGASDGQTLS